jgi:hypothetical protein
MRDDGVVRRFGRRRLTAAAAERGARGGEQRQRAKGPEHALCGSAGGSVWRSIDSVRVAQ